MTMYCLHSERQNTLLWFSARPTMGIIPKSNPQTLDKFMRGVSSSRLASVGWGLKCIAKAEFGCRMFYGTLQGTNPPWEKENHLEKCLGVGYVSSQEGIQMEFQKFQVDWKVLCYVDMVKVVLHRVVRSGKQQRHRR